jgi:hypothetical protein
LSADRVRVREGGAGGGLKILRGKLIDVLKFGKTNKIKCVCFQSKHTTQFNTIDEK